MLTAFDEKRRINETLVKEFQQCLTKNTYDTRRWQLGERPGTYKLHDYVTGRNEIGASPEDVKEEMDELLPIIIHEEDRKAYYEALESWDERQELDPFINFLREQAVKTWEKQLRRAEERKGITDRR